MAKTRTAPWDYDKREAPRTDADDQILAEWNLRLLCERMGEAQYYLWYSLVIAWEDSWFDIWRKARQALKDFDRDADERDYRETIRDALPIY